MHHIQYCLEEILAEIDVLLEGHTLVRALAQLDRREAADDPVTAIDGVDLRDCIIGRVRGLPLSQVRRCILEAKDLVGAAFGSSEPVPPRSNVILLSADGGCGRSDVVVKSTGSVASNPVARAAPQFKTMQERLAAAIDNGSQRHVHPRRA